MFYHHLDYGNLNDQVIIYAADSCLVGTGFVVGNAKKVGDNFIDIKICAYGSKKFDDCVKFQSSRSRELIGFSYGLEEFSDLLTSTQKIYGMVDHKSLERFESNASLGKTSTNTRVRKAFATILNFPNLEVCYVPAKSEIIELVDGLSRNITTMGSLSAEHFSNHQKK